MFLIINLSLLFVKNYVCTLDYQIEIIDKFFISYVITLGKTRFGSNYRFRNKLYRQELNNETEGKIRMYFSEWLRNPLET